MGRGALKDVSDETLKRRVRLSVVAQIIGQFTTSFLGLFVVKVVTATLGVGGFGVYSTATTFVFAFALLTDLGLNTVTAREISREPERAQDIISQNLGMRLSLTFFAIPIIFGLSFLLYRGGQSELRAAILVAACTLPFDSVKSIVAAYFTAHVLNVGTAVVNASQQLALLGFIAIAALAGFGPVWFVGAYLGAYAFAALLMLIRMRRVLRFRPRFTVSRWRPIIAASISVGLLQIVSVLYLRVDGIIISVMRSPSAAGVYAVAYLLVSAVIALASYIMTALIPSLANESLSGVASIVQRVLRAIAVLGCAIAAIGLVTAKDLVEIVSSSEYSGAVTPFRILIVANIFTGLITVVSYACVSTRRHRPIVLITIGTLALNVTLNFSFIPLWSLKGSAAATLICEVVMFILAIRALRHQVGHSPPVLGDIVRPLASGMAAVSAGWYASRTVLSGGMPVVLHVTLSGLFTLVVFAVFALFLCKEPFNYRTVHGAVITYRRSGTRRLARHRK